MDWEKLLDELWYFVESEPETLEAKIRLCLKGYSADGVLQAISLLIAQNQHSPAKALLCEHFKNHQASSEIQRRLELILHFQRNREPQLHSIQTSYQNKESLLKEVNDLVTTGKVKAAESLLREAITANEDVDYLNLLSRVLLLQRRTFDSAEAMQRALTLRREQQSFGAPPDSTHQKGLPTADDLAFIDETAAPLSDIDESSPSAVSIASADEALEDTWTSSTNRSPQEEPAQYTNDSDAPFIPDDEAPTPEEPSGTDSPLKNTTLTLNRPRQSRSPKARSNVRVINNSKRWKTTSDQNDEEPVEPLIDTETPHVKELEKISPLVREVFPTAAIYDDESDEESSYPDLEVATPTDAELRESGLEIPTDDAFLDDDSIDPISDELYEEIDENETVTDYLDLEDDYAAYAFDPDDVIDGSASEADEANDSLPDRLSREDRALQKAAELIANANWPLSALPLIQQIFIMNGWGATRLALEREIEKGLTPGELILAAHLKVVWAENDMYWIAFDRTGSSRLSHEVISWPTTLLIVRSFESFPQVEEIEMLLERLFATWYDNITLRRAFKAFARYLWFRFANLEGCLPASEQFDFCSPREFAPEEYSDLGLPDIHELQKSAILRDLGVPQSQQYQERSCYFSDLPPRDEASVLVAQKRSSAPPIDTADIDDEEEQGSAGDLIEQSALEQNCDSEATIVGRIQSRDYA